MIMGNMHKSEVRTDKGEITMVGNCFWCEQEVWSSGKVYSTDNPLEDVAVEPQRENARAVHKECFIDILKLAQEMAIAMQAQWNSEGGVKNDGEESN